MNIQFLLDAIARFENESKSSNETNHLIELFCYQVIPFLRDQASIELLRRRWRKKYEDLHSQIASLEQAALEEVTSAFRKIEQTVANRGSVAKKVARINAILSGNPGKAGFTSWPLYREVFFEIKGLLETVLRTRGGREICENYAILGVKEKRIIRVNKCPIVKREPYIAIFTFAPSVEKARLALDAAHWERTKDPAVMWHYFECALWCWNTEESYFEKTSDLLKVASNPFPALSEKAAWLEIAKIKNRLSIDHPPLIFTSRLFKEGFCALANEITIFLSNGCPSGDSKLPTDQVILELSLKEERLWVLVYMGLSKPKEVYLKRFNTGGINGSSPYDFIENLLQNHADRGEVLIDFADKSENIPKALERIGMRESFKNLFFGQSRGNKVTFHGSRIGIPRNEECRLLLEELDEIHQKAGCPRYPNGEA
ncbi:MAG: hypothetical protein HW387_1593 [Parachlamydiales bacterium]|nr:hypothetical protein [Parachlamydiales bacterium]